MLAVIQSYFGRRLRGLRHDGYLSQQGAAKPLAQRLSPRSSFGASAALPWLIFRL